jgi:hypothetical protein
MTFVCWFGLKDVCRCGSFISSLPSLPSESELRDFVSTGLAWADAMTSLPWWSFFGEVEVAGLWRSDDNNKIKVFSIVGPRVAVAFSGIT